MKLVVLLLQRNFEQIAVIIPLSMKRTRRDNSEKTSTSSTRTNTRMWSRGAFGASALLATAILLLAFAPFAHAAQPAQNLRAWNASWAVLSATFGDTDEAQTRVQGEQLWRWMQVRTASFSRPENLTPAQVAQLIRQWQVERGIEAPQMAKAKAHTSSTRYIVLASQLPLFPRPQIAPPTFAARPIVVSLPSHHAAKMSGVRSNRSHE